jgi:hypothetical protein
MVLAGVRDRNMLLVTRNRETGGKNENSPDPAPPFARRAAARARPRHARRCAKQVHWDGAKDEEAWVLIVGEGPGTNTPVEEAK